MPNIFHNTLDIYTPNPTQTEQLAAFVLSSSEIYEGQRLWTDERYGCTFSYSFRTNWKPPVNTYEALLEQARKIAGASLEATWVGEADDYDTRYRWLFDGDKYEVDETGLTRVAEAAADVARRRWGMGRSGPKEAA